VGKAFQSILLLVSHLVKGKGKAYLTGRQKNFGDSKVFTCEREFEKGGYGSRPGRRSELSGRAMHQKRR